MQCLFQRQCVLLSSIGHTAFAWNRPPMHPTCALNSGAKTKHSGHGCLSGQRSCLHASMSPFIQGAMPMGPLIHHTMEPWRACNPSPNLRSTSCFEPKMALILKTSMGHASMPPSLKPSWHISVAALLHPTTDKLVM